jgi:NadR type nicotinamide-nucleotide adenylyltransferase
MEIKKIVVIGPESTGKSTLCKNLATHYHTLWVAEYAREFLEKNGTVYDYNDLLDIAKGQVALEEQISDQLIDSDKKFLIIDTDMHVMKVWCEFVFNDCHSWILNRIAERKYDGYLLCDTDLPWVEDPLREYPDKAVREKLFQYYKDIMVNQPVPWITINGGYEERTEKAIAFINRIIH